MMNDLQLPGLFSLIAYNSIDSTNEEAKRLAETGAAHGTLVWAQSQEQGHGRRGRSWVSDPGNLYCSFILKPDRPVHEASQLSFVLAVSVAKTIDKQFQNQNIANHVQCKWPNDVLIGGKKASGILLEMIPRNNHDQASIVAGIGVNIEHFPTNTEFQATSLKAEGLSDVSTESFLEMLCDQFSRWYAIWLTEGFQTIRQAWLDKAFGFGETATVRLATETYSGVFETLDPQGSLILNDHGNRRHIAAGDVYFDPSVRQIAD